MNALIDEWTYVDWATNLLVYERAQVWWIEMCVQNRLPSTSLRIKFSISSLCVWRHQWHTCKRSISVHIVCLPHWYLLSIPLLMETPRKRLPKKSDTGHDDTALSSSPHHARKHHLGSIKYHRFAHSLRFSLSVVYTLCICLWYGLFY